jgi:hypothetical protein
MRPKRAAGRAFSFRAGVCLSETTITCDAQGSAADLVFLSHAQAVGALGQRRFPLRRAGRQELLATDATLALLGAAGARLHRHTLPTPFGRPFVLGDARVELFPSGHLPGSASLLVEVAGRRLIYAGTIRRERPSFGALPAEIRRADAVCIDGTFGDPRFALPPVEEALAELRRFVKETQAAGGAAVLLTSAYGTAMEVASALATVGYPLRGHRAVVKAAAAFRTAGAPPPTIARFAGRLGPSEVLLWPPEDRDASRLGALARPRFAFVSGFGLDPEALRRVRADVGIGLSSQSGFADLIAYLEATGAREVGIFRGFADELAATLRRKGFEAYAVGPPRQMELFRG